MLSYFDTEEQTPDQPFLWDGVSLVIHVYVSKPEKVKLYETCLKGSREEIRKYCHQGDIASQYIKDGMNPMHVVAIAGRADAEAILGIMLENGFDVNVQTMSGEDTVLHLIVEHVEIKEAFPLVLKILEYDPDLKIRNRKLRTAYDIALARGEFEMAEVLEGNMTAAQAREFYTQQIAALYGGKLVDAVLRSNENDIQDFLRLGADPNYVNEHKNGAIHYAITHCNLPPQKTLKFLIDGNADVNLQDDEGDTALNLVIKSTRLRESGDMHMCAKLLVENGAISTFKDLDGNDALNLAKKRQYEDIVKLLTELRPQHIREPVQSPEPPPQLQEEPEEIPEPPPDDEQTRNTQQETTPRPTTQQSPRGPVQDPSPRPPVRQQNNQPTPRFIPPPEIEEESEDDDYQMPPPPQYIMHDYLTPRDGGQGFLASVTPDNMMDHNMDPYPGLPRHREILAALILATREGTLEEVNRALFDLHADPNQPDDTGLYPIHHALIRGQFENEDDRLDMLRSLLEAGADINIPTVNSVSTPLHVAATKNQDHVAQLLLDTHKCDYNRKNKHDKTAYEVAEEEECFEVMEVIEAHRKKVRDRMKNAAKKASTCTIL